jgi:YVTN family beta-propeller protein
MAQSPDGNLLVVSNDGPFAPPTDPGIPQTTQSIMVINRLSGQIIQTIPYDPANPGFSTPQALYIGLAFSPDGTKLYAAGGGSPGASGFGLVHVYAVNEAAAQPLTELTAIHIPFPLDVHNNPIELYPSGLAISGDGNTLYAADSYSGNFVSIVSNLNTTPTFNNVLIPPNAADPQFSQNPVAVALSHDGKTLYVANWGDTTVAVVDLTQAPPVVTKSIAVGTHPYALALNPLNNELYVANADSDNVSVIDTTTNMVVRTINVLPYPNAPTGSSPDALAVSPDGKTLFVANATNNDVAVIKLGNAGTADQVLGLIPTAWYPSGLAVSPDGTQLNVLNSKGLGAGPNRQGPNPNNNPEVTDLRQKITNMIDGTISQIALSSASLAVYTQQVVQNDDFANGSSVRVAGQPDFSVVPLPGGTSPIKHVIYVIKENRTYDQQFGSLKDANGNQLGNGDPTLNLFDDASAPNQRALAKQFEVLDNFFADATVSADAWNWITGGLANTYVERNNLVNGHPFYDLEGGNFATSPGANPHDAFIWNKLSDANISYRNYGFRVSTSVDANGNVTNTVAMDPTGTFSTEPKLLANTDLNYFGYNTQLPDSTLQAGYRTATTINGQPTTIQTRIDEWLKEFNAFVAGNNLPTVELVRLPNDHTAGTRPSGPTPSAMVADNDLALGKLVDAVSHSPYWASTAIFVIEDDAQDGPDHVDAHRIPALVISPYTQTGKSRVDSTFYSTVSMLRTIELIVGLKPMSQYDAAATPILNSFVDTPNLTPYHDPAPDAGILAATNSADAPMADLALTFDFSTQDKAPSQLLNEMIWKSVKGADSEMPAPKGVSTNANGTSEIDSGN